MKYEISKATAPAMPNLGKGTECIKLLLSQASKVMHEPFVPMFFPVLGAHMSGTEFMYPDNSWKEPTGMMANLVAKSGDNKGQLSNLVEAICRDFRQHDEAETKRLLEWSKQKQSRGNNKDKPDRPEEGIWFIPNDTTNPAFLLNAMALEAHGGRTQYINIPEVEMADKLCGGHKQVSQMLRNIYDRTRAGALRATAEGVTGNPILRACMTISSNPYSTRKFYKYELFNGTFGRVVFSYKPRGTREGRIPRQGSYPDEFYQKLDEYLVRLDICKGRFIIRQLNKLIDRLAQDMASLADLTDDDVLFELSHRSLVSAWKAGCILWVLNNQTWTKSMGDLVEWLVYHDLWSKLQIFADMLKENDYGASETAKTGPQNMLDLLPDTFNQAQLEALRTSMDKTIEGTKAQLRQWLHRKFIEYCTQTGIYTKTELYLKGVKDETLNIKH
ncbi:hypothetical protein SAMN04488494_0901 [Xylanibacter ruminicola]|uniref:Uncharacterized protein n=1 Tax=Xylanibacter ruminicola TaxID=839 RepID=A0A1M7DZY0_XYLRU|nr:hypothetical protein [Xylanibacter ruminicola]SFB98441.1 hypothetical protein SAMN04488493_102407 [Xylanibacter ruminicola]SHL84908.1 hypothetical protein SAMN04488494_0901 [Xylanibacter ruminicola]